MFHKNRTLHETKNRMFHEESCFILYKNPKLFYNNFRFHFQPVFTAYNSHCRNREIRHAVFIPIDFSHGSISSGIIKRLIILFHKILLFLTSMVDDKILGIVVRLCKAVVAQAVLSCFSAALEYRIRQLCSGGSAEQI